MPSPILKIFQLLGVLAVLSIGSMLIGDRGIALAQVDQKLAHERAIRIVEPATFPLRRLVGEQDDLSDIDEFWRSCRLGGNVVLTDTGQAWIRCEMDPPEGIAYEGPNTTDRLWGDKTIKVTLTGFDTHEGLCWLDSDDAGVSDTRQFCDKGGRQIRATIVARFSMTTKIVRYTKEEDAESRELSKRLSGRINIAGRGPASIRITKAGEMKNWEISVTPVTYGFVGEK